jgi:class 3 adenylate cyclase
VRAFLERLAKGRLLIRYDKRGMGLSDWDVEDFSMEARLRDLSAVVDTVGLDQFDLFGISEGGAISIEYSARHTERVIRLVLYGAYPRIPVTHEISEPLLALIRTEWGMGSAALASVFVPGGDPAETVAFTKLQRIATRGDVAARMLEAILSIDVTAALKDVRAPTLVVHRRGDLLHPFNLARELASRIPDARLEPLEGDIYPPWWGDSDAILNAIDAFLEQDIGGGEDAETQATPSGLVTILFTDMEGSTALTQRLGDARAQELLRTHNAIVREALKAQDGAEIKHTGDGIMASFPSASKALGCATAIQTAFAERNETAEEPIKVRIGLNAGEPVAEDEDLFGTAVQLAARVCAHAQPGQVLASNVVRELSAGKPFLFSDQGDVVLRGFEDPVRLYEVRGGEEG